MIPKIIYRGVKATNMLMIIVICEAVVGDLGLVKLDPKALHVTTITEGLQCNIGHIAPECYLTGQSSEKTRVCVWNLSTGIYS